MLVKIHQPSFHSSRSCSSLGTSQRRQCHGQSKGTFQAWPMQRSSHWPSSSCLSEQINKQDDGRIKQGIYSYHLYLSAQSSVARHSRLGPKFLTCATVAWRSFGENVCLSNYILGYRLHPYPVPGSSAETTSLSSIMLQIFPTWSNIYICLALV